MNDRDEISSVNRIDATRAVYRRAAWKCAEHGATVEEAAIAAIYAAFDIAEAHAGPGQAAVEWLRTGCDLIEKSLVDNGNRISIN